MGLFSENIVCVLFIFYMLVIISDCLLCKGFFMGSVWCWLLLLMVIGGGVVIGMIVVLLGVGGSVMMVFLLW